MLERLPWKAAAGPVTGVGPRVGADLAAWPDSGVAAGCTVVVLRLYCGGGCWLWEVEAGASEVTEGVEVEVVMGNGDVHGRVGEGVVHGV